MAMIHEAAVLEAHVRPSRSPTELLFSLFLSEEDADSSSSLVFWPGLLLSSHRLLLLLLLFGSAFESVSTELSWPCGGGVLDEGSTEAVVIDFSCELTTTS